MMGMGLGLLSWDICGWRLSTVYFMILKKIKNLQWVVWWAWGWGCSHGTSLSEGLVYLWCQKIIKTYSEWYDGHGVGAALVGHLWVEPGLCLVPLTHMLAHSEKYSYLIMVFCQKMPTGTEIMERSKRWRGGIGLNCQLVFSN